MRDVTDSMTDREKIEPISSSPFSTNVTAGVGAPLSRSSLSAQMPCTSPVFMSKMPGPVVRSPSAASSVVTGQPASVPVGHTVS